MSRGMALALSLAEPFPAKLTESPGGKLAAEPGVAVALDRIVCVTGMSRGAGFEPKTGGDPGSVEEAGVFDEGWLGDESDPGGREPPVTGMGVPSGLETLIAGVPFSDW